MSISPKSQYEKQAKKIMERRKNSVNNEVPAKKSEVETSVPVAPEATDYSNATKKELKAVLDEASVTYGKDDKRDVLLALVNAL